MRSDTLGRFFQLGRFLRSAKRRASPASGTTETVQPASQAAPGAIPTEIEVPDCEAIDLARPGDEVRLFARLRAIGDAQRATAAHRTLPHSTRFRDIILTGPYDDDGHIVNNLERDLVREFPEERLTFRVASAFEPGEPLRAFFGLGVFAPSPDSLRVADLHFAWQPDPTPQDIVWPRRGPEDRESTRVAWYVGQRGLAVGFCARHAPAVLDRSRAPPNSAAIAALENVVLFFGRRDPHAAPVIRAGVRGTALRPMDVAISLEHYNDWWLRDGMWQWLKITIVGKGAAVLWFRLVGRTADVPFHPLRVGRRNDPGRDEGPRIIVRGLILPEPPPLLKSVGAFLRGGSLRWIVEFDGENRLRGNEICDLQRSVVADWGVRLAVWRHEPPGSWAGRDQSTDGMQNIALASGERVEVREFPPSFPKEKDREKSRSISTLYRRQWCLLQFEDDGAFGWIAVFPTAVLSELPIDGTPDDDGSHADAEPTIGLDWLNRAAHVSIGNVTMGLAQYWARNRRVRLQASERALEVTVIDRAGPISYRIGVGQLGPVGPLYVEYRTT